MWLSLQKKPVDFVLATGKTHTVRQFINEALKYYGFLKLIGQVKMIKKN